MAACPESRECLPSSVAAPAARSSFAFRRAKDQAAEDRGVAVEFAQAEQIGDIMDIQRHSPADRSIWLTPEQVTSLVANQQVLVATTMIKGQPLSSGAIFVHCSTDPSNYDFIRTPATHAVAEPGALYDFWILAHDERRRSADGTGVAKTLIEASAELARILNKKGPIAYSRAGEALSHSYSEYQVVHPYANLDDFNREVNSNNAYKGLLLLRHILTTGVTTREEDEHPLLLSWMHDPEYINTPDETKPEYFKSWLARLFPGKPMYQLVRDIRTAWIRRNLHIRNSSVDFFLNWVESYYPEALNLEQAYAIRHPDVAAVWDPTGDNDFIRLMGLLLRRFVNEGQYAPIDLSLGSLHTRYGARLARIHLNSRPGDMSAMDSNVEMNYEHVDDITKEIGALLGR